MKIGGKKLGPREKTFIVAEVGQAHDGSVGYAHSFICTKTSVFTGNVHHL